MGLLLSVLVACVGVIELIAFYHNVRRNITSPPVHGSFANISDRYRKELRGIQHRLDGDLQSAQDIPPPGPAGGIPTFRLNSHEDIEIEYDESLLRSRSASPRSFLVTEKDRKSESPRRFVVSDETEAHKKTKSQDSIPEFLIHEQKNSPKSPNKPRYVLCEQQDESSHPIPLPRQFIVTEDELNTLVFDETCRPNENQDKDRYRRSPSPYPPLELPHVPRNSLCNALLENPTFSVVEYDEDDDSSTSSPEKVDMILESTHFNTTQYWTNKILVSPSKHHRSRHHSHGEHLESNKERSTASERTRSKSESENQDSNNNLHAIPNNRAVSNFELSRSLEKDDTTYDAKYLNSLDGVSRTKQKSSRKAFVKRKNASSGSLDRAKESIPESSNENTTKTLSEAVKELKKISENDVESKDKTGEPFWVKE